MGEAKELRHCNHAAARDDAPLGDDRAREIAASLSQEARSTLMWCVEVKDRNDGKHRVYSNNPSYDVLHRLELIWSPFILPATNYVRIPEDGPTAWGREVAALFVRTKDMTDVALRENAEAMEAGADRTMVEAELARRSVPA